MKRIEKGQWACLSLWHKGYTVRAGGKRGAFITPKKKKKGDNQMLTFFSPTNESSLKLKLN